jgi:vinculin
LCRSGQGNSPQAQAVAKYDIFVVTGLKIFLNNNNFFFRLLSQKLDELKDKIQGALVDRVVEDFIDITTPLKQFTDAVLTPEGDKVASIFVN